MNEKLTLLEDSWHAELLRLWRKFLKIEDVSIDDDLFEKGGDSLLAIDLQLELQRFIGQQLPESLLFEASTVRALSKRLASLPGAQAAITQMTSNVDAEISPKLGLAEDRAHASFARREQSAND